MSGQSITQYYGDLLTMAGNFMAPQEEIPDNAFDGCPTFEYMARKGRAKWSNYGQKIQERILYDKQGGGGPYGPYQVLDTNPGENWTIVEYERKTYYQSATIAGKELRACRGNVAQVRDLAKERVAHAKMRQLEDLETDVYLDGTGPNSLQQAIGGFAQYIQEVPSVDPTILVGGLSGASRPFWRNYTKGAIGSFAANGLAEFDKAYIQISRGRPSGVPDLIVWTSGGYEFFESANHGKQQFYMNSGKDKTLDPGFARLWYKDIPQIFSMYMPKDSGGLDQCLWLNSRWIYFRIHPDAYFVQDPWIRPANQEAISSQNIVEVNLTMTNRRHTGRLFGITR